MASLSSLLRVISILAATITVFIYVQGGNKLKRLKNVLDQKQTEINQQNDQLAVNNQSYKKIKSQLDSAALKLTEHKRDQRLKESEVLIVRQELASMNSQLDQTQATLLIRVDENESLKRENIDLRAQGFDPLINPKTLTAKIDEQQNIIRSLETELSDSQIVLNSIFSQTGQMVQETRIEKAFPNRRILVLKIGSNQGIRENIEFALLKSGNLIAKVKAARVTSERCVVNIVSNISSPDVLRQGLQIEYML